MTASAVASLAVPETPTPLSSSSELRLSAQQLHHACDLAQFDFQTTAELAGLPNSETGGAAGDLFAVVHSEPDARFERLGADLLHAETISVTQAVLGAQLKVPTLQGSATVEVPPGTQPDAVLRLKNQGLPGRDGGVHGDLYVRLNVRIPQQLSPRERVLYQQLQALSEPHKSSAP